MKNVVAKVDDPVPLEALNRTRVYQVMEKLNATNKISRDDADYVARWLNNNEIFDDAIPYFGWRFDFAVFMKIFEVKLGKKSQRVYGFDKESVRKALGVEVEDCSITLVS